MGYYTSYTLKASGRHEQIGALLEEYTSGYQWDDYVDSWCMNGKWYGHEDDMSALSAAFPDVLFTLEGEGEESGDIWKAYYLQSKSKKVQAEISFADPGPEFVAPELLPDPVDEEYEAWKALGLERGWTNE